MCRTTLWIIGLVAVGIGPISAQSPPAMPAPDARSPVDANQPIGGSPNPMAIDCSFSSTTPYPRVWVRSEYLMWWVKSSPLPVPVVTTGDPAVGFDPTGADTVNTAGALDQPGTQILVGGAGIKFPVFSGARLTLGGWSDDDRRLGLEVGGYLLGRRTERFSAASDAAGNPPLYFPICSGRAGAERGIPIADPLRRFSGDVTVSSSLQLGGLEGNVVCNVYRLAEVEVAVLAGYRYAELRESLQIQNATRDLIF